MNGLSLPQCEVLIAERDMARAAADADLDAAFHRGDLARLGPGVRRSFLANLVDEVLFDTAVLREVAS